MLPIGVSEAIVIYLKGVLMGMADIVPGVSGGTMALITGIYERLVHAIRTLNLRWLTRRLRGDVECSREAWGHAPVA